jgi:hypothetical protein
MSVFRIEASTIIPSDESILCPYCGHHYASRGRASFSKHETDISNCYQAVPFVVETHTEICANPECLKPAVYVAVWIPGPNTPRYNQFLSCPDSQILLPLKRILPEPGGKLFENVPPHVWKDYHEACGIRELSPRASATLARRCLQNMIRDFWGISKSTLMEEINAVGEIPGVTEQTLSALISLKDLGNIGAQPEHDINIIVDIEPAEAELMIRVIGMLFAAWYDARAAEEKNLKEIQALNARKQNERKP